MRSTQTSRLAPATRARSRDEQRYPRSGAAPREWTLGARGQRAALLRAADARLGDGVQARLLRHRAGLLLVPVASADALCGPSHGFHAGLQHRLRGQELSGVAAL